MAYVVQTLSSNTGGSGSSPSVSGTFTAGNLLVVVGATGAGTGTVSANETFTKKASALGDSYSGGILFFTAIAQGGTETITFNGGGGFGADLIVYEVNGAVACTLDGHNGQGTSGTNPPTTVDTGSITTTINNDCVIGAMFSQSPTWTFQGTYTNSASAGTYEYNSWGSYSIWVAGICAFEPPSLTSVSVSPSSVTLLVSGTQQFTATAYDQCGNALSGQSFTWSIQSGGGSVSGTGLYTAPSTPGSAVVRATDGSVYGTANVTIKSNAAAQILMTFP